MHPALSGGGSYPEALKWFSDQDGTPPPKCGAADVDRLFGITKHHEGAAQETDSHYGILQRFIAAESVSTKLKRFVDHRTSIGRFLSAVDTHLQDVNDRHQALQHAFEAPQYAKIFGNQEAPNGPFGDLGCKIAWDPTLVVPGLQEMGGE